jgi:hypothetical protein
MKEDCLAFADIDDAHGYNPYDYSGRYLEPAVRGIPLKRGEVFPFVEAHPMKDSFCTEIRLPSGKNVYIMAAKFDIRPKARK